MADRLTRIMAAQFKGAIKEDHPNLIPLISERKLTRQWHFLITNLPEPFEGGEYIFCLDVPSEFPQKPPSLSFLTPNGIYEPGGKICISIGEFHAADSPGASGAYGWRPALGMIGFAREVVNGMIVPESLGGGIRIIASPSSVVKATHAKKSVAFNQKKHPDLMSLADEFIAGNPGHAAVRLRKMWGAVAQVTDFHTSDAATLRGLLGDAFGPELWALMAECVTPAIDTPGRKPLLAVSKLIRECLVERELPIRRELALILRARLYHDLGNRTLAREAFRECIAEISPLCGGACGEIIPNSLAKVDVAALPKIHGYISSFLRAQNIDVKARLGRSLAARIEQMAAEVPAEETPAVEVPAVTPAEGTPAVEVPAVTPAVEAPAEAPAVEAPAAPLPDDEFDTYIDSLIDDIP